MSSSEIAAANNAFAQQTMARDQYSSSIGQRSPYGGQMTNGSQGDRFMAQGMNHAAGVGVPLAAAGMSLMGLDPFSIGLKAGTAAAGTFGMAGGAAVGAGVALPMMAGLGAAKYAGSQMMEGASQQSVLNQTMRGSFNFRNSAGGQGFDRQDMSQIGGMVRNMSEQFGPGGEITGFRELTTLAGKMGSMGFAQGVRDVKEFSSKFKEMVTTLKGMAKDLGTTLEGAMEFAAASKGSGVFGMGNAAKFTGSVRAASVSGGLAISEVTAAASIGSQISRSIGGLGRQGAAAGVRTIGQIGNAQQMGVLSEEDIYNVTGLTGAEGRQAYAANSMQKAGSFLQTTKGRYTLASLAGKNGQLDEGGVQELLAGGMDIGETKRRAGVMKQTVGRANFIRNEGRLRGAALERIGAFLPALQLKEWAESKGVDINDMDDRSMLFAQRHLGMGRDEVDQAVKMANALPAIAQRMRDSSQDDSYFQKLAQERKQQGVEGVKQRFDQAKEKINGKLQSAGQNLFNAGSEAIDQWLNQLTGTYEHAMTEKADNAIRNMKWGGNKQELRQTLGSGSGFRGGGVSSMSASAFTAGADSKGDFLARGVKGVLMGQSMAEKYSEAGYKVDTSSDASVRKGMQDALAFSDGTKKSVNGFAPMDGKLRETLFNAYMENPKANARERIPMLQEKLRAAAQGGDAKAAALLEQLTKAGPGQQGMLLNSIEQQLPLDESVRARNAPDLPGMPGAGLAPGVRGRGYADAIMGDASLFKGTALGGVVGSALSMGLLGGVGAAVGGKLQSILSGDDARRSGLGKYLTSEEGQSNAFKLFGGGGQQIAKDTAIRMQSELHKLSNQGLERGERATSLAVQLSAQEYGEALQRHPNGQIPPDEIAAITKKYGASSGITTSDGLRNALGVVGKAASEQDTLVRQEEASRVRTRSTAEEAKMRELGILTDDGSRIRRKKSFVGADGLNELITAQKMSASWTGDPAQQEQIRRLEISGTEKIARMSEAQRSALAQDLAGTDIGSTVATINADERRISRGLKKSGATKTLLGGLGLSLSRDQMKSMNMDDPEAQKRLEEFIIDNSGGKNMDPLSRKAVKGKTETLMAAYKHKDIASITTAEEALKNDPAVQKAAKDKQDQDENNNPAVREAKLMNKNLLDLIGETKKVSAGVGELKMPTGDAEGGGGGSGGPTLGGVVAGAKRLFS